jgi:predicted alpha/beta-fold hydrolase
LPFLAAIRIPALLIQAQDDTFIPFRIFESAAARGNRRMELLATNHGGHLGFLARGAPRFWADRVIMDWITRL